MKIRHAMNVAKTVSRHATLGQKLTVSLSCLILTPVRTLQNRLDGNDMGGNLYSKQLKRFWSSKASAIREIRVETKYDKVIR